jgi:hypothetical protein
MGVLLECWLTPLPWLWTQDAEKARGIEKSQSFIARHNNIKRFLA